jgi:hypothetical protein
MQRGELMLSRIFSVVRPAALTAALVLVPAAGAMQPGRGGGGTQIQPGQQCPPGMTEVRPLNCQAPTLPVPSIVDYRPRSTLIAPAHPVQKAKFPVIDYHGHPGQLNSADGLAQLGASLDSINVRLIVSASNTSGEALGRTVELVRNSATMKDRVRVLTGISFNNVGPGWAEGAIARLEADVAAGAVGVGEIGKQFGLSTRKADGTRLRISFRSSSRCRR